MPKFVSDNLVQYMHLASQEKFFAHLVVRIRKDARLDLEAGDKAAPQIADNLEGDNLYKAMAAYFNWKRAKGPVHTNSPISFLTLEVVTFGYDNALIKSHVFDDAAVAVRDYRFGKHYIKNYCMSEGSKEMQK